MRFFVRFLMMQVIFVVIEYKISHFLALIQFTISPVFRKFFAGELFVVIEYYYYYFFVVVFFTNLVINDRLTLQSLLLHLQCP
jgi:hypothetical protein